MSKVAADLEAIQAFRQALLAFAGRQSQTLQKVDMAIDRAQAMLERAEYHAQQMAWRLSQELDACYAAAAQGYAVDCSQVYYALAEAEQELDHIRNVKRRLETVLRPYYHARNDLERALTTELAQATTFRTAALPCWRRTTPLRSSARQWQWPAPAF